MPLYISVVQSRDGHEPQHKTGQLIVQEPLAHENLTPTICPQTFMFFVEKWIQHDVLLLKQSKMPHKSLGSTYSITKTNAQLSVPCEMRTTLLLYVQ